MKKLLLLLLFAGFSLAAYWTTPLSCPATYLSQSCVPNRVCGVDGSSIAYCWDTPSFVAPATSPNTQTTYGSTGGWQVDCYAFDAANPRCDNTGAFWCGASAACTATHNQTTCTASAWLTSTCADACVSGWIACWVGCDVQPGITDCDPALPGKNCAVDGSCLPACKSGYLDCDGGGVNSTNGCEVLDGGSCSVGGIPGTWSGCTCVTTPQHHLTGVQANGSSGNPNLWTQQFGAGWIFNGSSVPTGNWLGINESGCLIMNSPLGVSTSCNLTGSGDGSTYDADELWINLVGTTFVFNSSKFDGVIGNLTDNVSDVNSSIRALVGNVSGNLSANWTELLNTQANLSVINASLWGNLTAFNESDLVWSLFGNLSGNLTDINNTFILFQQNVSASNTSIWVSINIVNSSLWTLFNTTNGTLRISFDDDTPGYLEGKLRIDAPLSASQTTSGTNNETMHVGLNVANTTSVNLYAGGSLTAEVDPTWFATNVNGSFLKLNLENDPAHGILDVQGGAWVKGSNSTHNATPLVPASAYPGINLSGYQFGNELVGAGNVYYLFAGNDYRIRQDGWVQGFDFYYNKTTNDFNLTFQIWRPRADGQNFTLVATSESVFAQVGVAGYQNVTLTTPLLVREGDYIGALVSNSNSEGQQWIGNSVLNGSTLMFAGTVTTNFNWSDTGTVTTVSYYVVGVQAKMGSPKLIFLGDSIMAGYNQAPNSNAKNHFGYIDNRNMSDALNLTQHYKTRTALNWTAQEMAVGGQLFCTEIAPRFAKDVVAYSPQAVVTEGGVNDIIQSQCNLTNFIANYTSILTLAQNNNIFVVVESIAPANCTVLGNYTKCQLIEEYNSGLKNLTESYSNAVFVNMTNYVGCLNASGDGWEMCAAYVTDGLHFNPLGYSKMAKAVLDALGGVRADSLFAYDEVLNDGLTISTSGTPASAAVMEKLTTFNRGQGGLSNWADNAWLNNYGQLVARTDAFDIEYDCSGNEDACATYGIGDCATMSGCAWFTSGICGGTALACNTWNGNPVTCVQQTGCMWDGVSLCLNMPAHQPCNSYGNQPLCVQNIACNWIDTSICFGTHATCSLANYPDETSCEGNTTCVWSETETYGVGKASAITMGDGKILHTISTNTTDGQLIDPTYTFQDSITRTWIKKIASSGTLAYEPNDNFRQSVKADATSYSTQTFNGSGLDDAAFSGTYGDIENRVIILMVSTAAATDKFKYSLDNGTSWSAEVSMTGAAQLIWYIYVTFGATTGHTLGDAWYVNATANNLYAGYNNSNDEVFSVDYYGRIRLECYDNTCIKLGHNDTSEGFAIAHGDDGSGNGLTQLLDNGDWVGLYNVWVARGAEPSGILFNNGKIGVYSDSGKTAGSTYTPTERFAVDYSGANFSVNVNASPYNISANQLYAVSVNISNQTITSRTVSSTTAFYFRNTTDDVLYFNYATMNLGSSSTAGYVLSANSPFNFNTGGSGEFIWSIGGNAFPKWHMTSAAFYPEGNKTQDAGIPNHYIRNVYLHAVFAGGIPSYEGRDVLSELLEHPLQEKKPGDFDEKGYDPDGKFVTEYDPKSLPVGLYENKPLTTWDKNNTEKDNKGDPLNATSISIGGLAGFNYKVNYEQQLLIENLTAENAQLQSDLSKLEERVVALEKKVFG